MGFTIWSKMLEFLGGFYRSLAKLRRIAKRRTVLNSLKPLLTI